MLITLTEESINFIGLSQYLLLILHDFIKNRVNFLIRKSYKGNKPLILFGLLINLANMFLFQVVIETLEKGVEYDVIDVVLVYLLLTLNIFHTFL